MSLIKHGGITKQPYLLELNSLSGDTSADEVRQFVVDNFLIKSDADLGVGVEGIFFLKPNLAKKFALEG